MTNWLVVGVSVALSVLTSGGVAAALATLFNGGLQRRLTARLEAAKNANAEKLKSVDASIAELIASLRWRCGEMTHG